MISNIVETLRRSASEDFLQRSRSEQLCNNIDTPEEMMLCIKHQLSEGGQIPNDYREELKEAKDVDE